MYNGDNYNNVNNKKKHLINYFLQKECIFHSQLWKFIMEIYEHNSMNITYPCIK